MKKTNKAFTIVELVIVIAVIAILAAVLIPTFSNLIEKANESKDTSLVKNINTALVMEEVNQSKNNTMSDALEDALTHGYTIEKLTPTSNGDIVWDEVNNRFALMKNDTLFYGTEETKELVSKGDLYKLWKITDDANEVQDENAKYSFYLKDGFAQSIINVKTGIDLGKCSNVSQINYTSTETNQEVVFNTNSFSTKLVISAKDNDVIHYGNAYEVEIKAVKDSSYHEYGKVFNKITIESGHVQLEKGSEVATLLLKESSDSNLSQSKATLKEGSLVNTVLFMTINTNLTVENNSILMSIGKSDNNFDLTNKITGSSLIPVGVDVENVDKFMSGLGTKENPYGISNVTHLKNISDLKSIINEKPTYFKLTDNIFIEEKDFEEKTELVYGGRNLYFDGNDKKISYINNYENTGYSLFEVFSGEIKNINIYYPGKRVCQLVKIVAGNSLIENVNYGDENIKETINGGQNNNSFYVRAVEASYISSTEKTTLHFKNCKNYYSYDTMDCMNISIGIFVGWNQIQKKELKYYIFDNCANYGNIIGDNVAIFFGNDQYITQDNIKIINFTNEGTVKGTKSAKIVGWRGAASYICDDALHYDNNGNVVGKISDIPNYNTTIIKLSDSNLGLSLNEENKFIINKAEKTVTKYRITFTSWATLPTGSLITQHYFDFDNIQFEENGQYQTNLYNYKIMDINSYNNTYSNDLSGVNWIKSSGTDLLEVYEDKINNVLVFRNCTENDRYNITINANNATNIILYAYNENNVIACKQLTK